MEVNKPIGHQGGTTMQCTDWLNTEWPLTVKSKLANM